MAKRRKSKNRGEEGRGGKSVANGATDQKSAGVSRDRMIVVLTALLGVIFFTIAFARIADFPFLAWDDQYHIVANPAVNPPSWSNLKRIWSAPIGNLYIPLSYTVFMFEAWIGLNHATGAIGPAVFHATSLLLYAGSAICVFFILRRLFGKAVPASVGTAIFAVHPIQVEAYAWISETRGLFATLLGFLAILAWLRSAPVGQTVRATDEQRERVRWGFYAIATVFFVMALLSKPSAAALPLVVVAFDRLVTRRSLKQTVVLIAPWVAAAAGFLLITSWLQPARDAVAAPPILSRLLIAGDAVAFYLHKLAWPAALGADYGRIPGHVLNDPGIWITGTLPWLLVVLLFVRRVPKRVRLGIAVFLASLLPVLGFVPFDHQAISTTADRYAYPAMLGVAIVVGWLALRWRRAGPPLVVAIALCLSIKSYQQLAAWENDDVLFSHALEVNPDSSLAHNNLGFWLVAQHHVAEGVEHYRKAIELDPTNHTALVNLGAQEELAGHLEEAEWLYRRALNAKPDYATAYANLGSLLDRRGRYAEAEPFARRAIELRPNAAEWQYNDGVVLTHLGRLKEAVDRYERALELDPDHAGARRNLRIVRRVIEAESTE